MLAGRCAVKLHRMAYHPPEHVYPRMVHDFYAERIRTIEAERDARLAAIRTADDARKYAAQVREKARACFGPRPESTPLNVRVTGTLEREAYVVDKLIYESRPGYHVTACLYRPKTDGPHPGVLGLCGHSVNGKAHPNYQQYCRSLATMGYIVLMPDPVSQGERYQYEEADRNWQWRDPCKEHNIAGAQMSLVGDFFGMWRAWDAIRGLDYLLSRPDIDKSRVGVTGNSGGGTLSSYVNLLDDRITMTAISCFITTFRSNFDNELPADSEQYPPGIIGAGLDMGDYILAQAPRPTLLLGQAHDFFDIRGLKRTFEQCRRVYDLLGAGDSVQMHIGPGIHGYWTENRQAMYRFFKSHARVDAPPAETTDAELSEADLQVTPAGKVTDLPGNRRVYQFTADTARALSRSRPKLSGDTLIKAINDVLNLSPRTSLADYRKLRARGNDYAQPYERVHLFAVQTEPSLPPVEAILHAWQRDKESEEIEAIPQRASATVCIPHISSRSDITGGEMPIKADELVFSIDARGIGMSTAMTCNDRQFFALYGADYMYAGHGLMLGQSYVGRRVHDVLTTLDLLVASGTKEIHLIGRGLGSVLAAFAGALHPNVSRVTLKHHLPSFESLATANATYWPLSSLPRGILKTFDLPDVYQLLTSKQLKLTDAWDARMQAP